MTYLDFSMVLPSGTPVPDLSGQPVLQDYMSNTLWERRHIVYTRWADPMEQETFRAASQRWLQDVRDHCRKLEEELGIEFCNWTAHSPRDYEEANALTIGHADQDPAEHRTFTTEQIEEFLMSPRKLEELAGWHQSSTMQRQALMEAMREFTIGLCSSQQLTDSQEQ